MMNSYFGRILKLGPLSRDLFVSAAGGFAFTRCFRLIALGRVGREGSGTGSSICVASPSRKPLAGIGAALFLLAFVTSEALATIRALGR
jgi:hypothetical protein